MSARTARSTHTRLALLALLGSLFWPPRASAETSADDLARRKAELEAHKLALEIAKLKDDQSRSSDWSALGGLLAGIGGTAVTWWVARRARHGELDKTVHEKRLTAYPTLVQAMSPLAVFFPHTELGPALRLDQTQCAKIGATLSKWYFEVGGLLMSPAARDSYFRFITALTRASKFEGTFKVPQFPDHAQLLSVELVDKYRAELEATLDLNAVDVWIFGDPSSPPESADSDAYRFKDYVFLQRLSSSLRTTLAADLRSRRRPS